MKSVIHSSVMAAKYGIKSTVFIRICRDLWNIQYLCAVDVTERMELTYNLLHCTKIQSVTGFWKTIPNRTFGISRNTNFKYSWHCISLVLDCSHARLAPAVDWCYS